MSAHQKDRKPSLLMDEHKIKEDPDDFDFADEIFNFENFKQKFRIVCVRVSTLHIPHILSKL
jgi:hypothetical protein